jgi:hypothetical protein
MHLEIPILDQEYETNRSRTKGIPKMDTFIPSNRYLRGDPKHEIVSNVNSTIRSDGTGRNRSVDFNSADSLKNVLDLNEQVTNPDLNQQVAKTQFVNRKSIESAPSWGVISNRYDTNQAQSNLDDSINLWDHTKRGDDVFKKSPCILKMEKCPFAPIYVVGQPPELGSGKIEPMLPMIDESVELDANSLNSSFGYSSNPQRSPQRSPLRQARADQAKNRIAESLFKKEIKKNRDLKDQVEALNFDMESNLKNQEKKMTGLEAELLELQRKGDEILGQNETLKLKVRELESREEKIKEAPHPQMGFESMIDVGQTSADADLQKKLESDVQKLELELLDSRR